MIRMKVLCVALVVMSHEFKSRESKVVIAWITRLAVDFDTANAFEAGGRTR